MKDIFHQAAERPASERDRFLDAACADDLELRSEVDALLQADAESEDAFMDPPPAAALHEAIRGDEGGSVAAMRDAFREDRDSRESLIGEHIGPYRLVRRVASGGMGVIYLADRANEDFKQRVAIKVIKRGMDTEDILRRFRRERRTLARLAHPYIARLIDGGATDDGRPYLVMEYIDGRPIDQYCDDRALDIHARLELFQRVCEAVQFAHANLIVHRDLKPSNILVTEDGTPKLLDFGIAKLLQDPDVSDAAETADRSRLMTPRYASPEQARGGAITTATDVYALGLILYELLTGHRAYRIDTRERSEVERVICEEEPVRPSTVISRVETARTEEGVTRSVTPESVSMTRGGRADRLRRRLAGDLDNIVLMALRKEPERRYPTVRQFSLDLGNYLDRRPVAARPDTFAYRASKFVERNRAGVATAALVVVSLVAGIVATSLESSRAWRAEKSASHRLETYQAMNNLLLEIFESPDPMESPDTKMDAVQILDRGAERIRSELADQPLVRATMMSAIGNAYRNIGAYEKARPLLEEALEQRREILGELDPDTATSYDSLGMLMNETGKYDESERLLSRCLELRRKLLDESDELLARSENNLGLVLKNLSRLGEAEDHFERAVAMRRKIFGDEHRRVAYSLNNLADIRYSQNDYDGAEELHREALAIRRKVLPEGHPDIAESVHDLAVTLRELKRHDEAESLYRQALDLYVEKYGEEHRKVAHTMSSLGSVLRDLERFGEAKRLFESALSIQRRVLGDDHPDVAMALNSLARLYLQVGRYEQAQAPLNEALEIQRAAYTGNHRHTALTLMNLGWAEHGLAALDKAEAYYREALEMYESLYGHEHRHVGVALESLSSVFHSAQRSDQAAAEVLASRLAWLEEHDAESREVVADAAFLLGSCHLRGNRVELAEQPFLRSYEIWRAVGGEGDERAKAIADRLVTVYSRTGRPDRADERQPDQRALQQPPGEASSPSLGSSGG